MARTSDRPWTLLKEKGQFQLWQQDRQDPAGKPITMYRGAVFMIVSGERRQTPVQPAFTNLADAEAWFAMKIGAPGD